MIKDLGSFYSFIAPAKEQRQTQNRFKKHFLAFFILIYSIPLTLGSGIRTLNYLWNQCRK